jgi:hypothetical protein
VFRGESVRGVAWRGVLGASTACITPLPHSIVRKRVSMSMDGSGLPPGSETNAPRPELRVCT